MRIAYMLTSLGRGGAERQVVALAERMAARGHQVAIVVLRSRQTHEWPTDLCIVRLDMKKSISAVRGFTRARKFLSAFQPDLVHSHTFPGNLIARVLNLAGAAKTVLSTIHNVYEGEWQRTFAYRLTDRLAIHTTAVSEVVAERYIQIGAVPRRKCSVITNGVDTTEFSPSLQTASRVREFLQTEGDFVWLAAGRSVPAKDFENLLAAFQTVRAESPQARLLVAGERSRSDGARWCESDGVQWLGLRDDMPATIAAADAFVLSSAWEGMPLVVGEAMAMEKPVVATDVGGVRELVGDTGFIVSAKDPDSLASAMLCVMRLSRGDRTAMGRTARSRIVQHFDINVKANEWEALYAQLLENRFGQPG